MKSLELKAKSVTKADNRTVTTYDSTYEHSLEHWIELRRLVQEADEEYEQHPAARYQAR